MLIQEKDRKTLQEIFQKRLINPVRLVVFSQHKSPLVLPVGHTCQMCAETEMLAKELGELTDKITVEIYDILSDKEKAEEFKIDKIPALALLGQKDAGIRFYGIPAGYEFTTLVEDIVDVSKGTTALSANTKQKLKEIDQDVHIQVFVTPTCPYCPMSVRIAHQMAIECEFIHADMVEATEFPVLAHRYNVQGVPRIVINEEHAIEGMLPEPIFLLLVLNAIGKLSEREQAKLKKFQR